VTIFALTLLTAPLAAEAQSAGRVYRVGLFHVGLDHVPPSLEGLRDGLKALGYDVGTSPMPMVSTVAEGKNIRLDWPYPACASWRATEERGMRAWAERDIRPCPECGEPSDSSIILCGVGPARRCLAVCPSCGTRLGEADVETDASSPGGPAQPFVEADGGR
jgi:hypothetical protein